MSINFNLDRNINNFYLSSCHSDLDIAVENGDLNQVTSIVNSIQYKNFSLKDLESILQKALNNSKLDIANIILNSNRAEELGNLSLSYLINNKEEHIVKTIVRSEAFNYIDNENLLSNMEKIPLLQIVLNTPKVFEILEEGLQKAAASNNIEILNAFLLSTEINEIFEYAIQTPLEIAKSNNSVEFMTLLLTHKKCILEIDNVRDYLKYLITHCAYKDKEDILNCLFASKKFHKKIPYEIIPMALQYKSNEKIKQILITEQKIHNPDYILKESLQDPVQYLKSPSSLEDTSITISLLNCKNCIKDLPELLIYFSKNENTRMIELILNCNRSKEISISNIIDALKVCTNKKNILRIFSKENIKDIFEKYLDNKDVENIIFLLHNGYNFSFDQLNRAMQLAISNNNLQFVEKIINYNNITIASENLEMALTIAIETKNSSILSALLNCKIQITDELLERIVNKGADCNNIEIIEFILKNITKNNQLTPNFLDKFLETAVRRDLSYIVDIILTNEKLKNLVSKKELIECANLSKNSLILKTIVDSCPQFFLQKILDNALEESNKQLIKVILECDKLEKLPSDKIDKAIQIALG